MTPNQRVVATAARYVGVRENPLGSNRGPLIDKWERYWNLGYLGWPWCGAFASAVLRESDVTDVSHPSTAEICRKARDRGWVTNTPVPGALIVWCGTHVGILISPASADGSVWNTIEGNSGDQVARRVRSLAGCTIVVSPELRHGKLEPSRAYYLEDTRAKKPALAGPWRTRAMRERAINKLSPAAKRTVRRVKVGGKYAFEYGGERRVYGPWLDEASRDSAQKVLRERLGRPLRTFSRSLTQRVPASADALGKTT